MSQRPYDSYGLRPDSTEAQAKVRTADILSDEERHETEELYRHLVGLMLKLQNRLGIHPDNRYVRADSISQASQPKW